VRCEASPIEPMAKIGHMYRRNKKPNQKYCFWFNWFLVGSEAANGRKDLIKKKDFRN